MSRRDVSRRSFVQAGVLGAGGLGLSELLQLKAQAANARSGKKTSVILFWLSGGPGHMETWDPKPGAPAEVRGPFGAISTSVPGIQFGELMPNLAKRMDKLAVLRSVNHGSGDHTKSNHWMLTGFEGPAFNALIFVNNAARPWDLRWLPWGARITLGCPLMSECLTFEGYG